MIHNFQLSTEKNDTIDITERVKQTITQSGVVEGFLIVCIPHTTAALSITSIWDPLGLEDIHDDLNRLVPTRVDFKHQHDTPSDASAHIKSVLVGVTLTLPITNGGPLLGHSQGIFFHEFDGPRKREFNVMCVKA